MALAPRGKAEPGTLAPKDRHLEVTRERRPVRASGTATSPPRGSARAARECHPRSCGWGSAAANRHRCSRAKSRYTKPKVRKEEWRGDHRRAAPLQGRGKTWLCFAG